MKKIPKICIGPKHARKIGENSKTRGASRPIKLTELIQLAINLGPVSVRPARRIESHNIPLTILILVDNDPSKWKKKKRKTTPDTERVRLTRLRRIIRSSRHSVSFLVILNIISSTGCAFHGHWN